MKDENDDLGSLGSLEPTLGIPGDSDPIGDKFDDVVIDGGLPSPSVVEPVEPLACNPATMVCLRGPCEHMWPMVKRLVTHYDIINLERTQYCMIHQELQSLADENLFTCGQWWPAWLVWVPKTVRPLIRPYFHEFWDIYLKLLGKLSKDLARQGYDFRWKWWPKSAWEMPKDELNEIRQEAIRRKREEKAREQEMIDARN